MPQMEGSEIAKIGQVRTRQKSAIQTISEGLGGAGVRQSDPVYVCTPCNPASSVHNEAPNSEGTPSGELPANPR